MNKIIVFMLCLSLFAQQSKATCLSNYEQVLIETSDQARAKMKKEERWADFGAAIIVIASGGTAGGLLVGGLGWLIVQDEQLTRYYNSNSIAMRANAIQMITILQSVQTNQYSHQIELLTERLRRNTGLADLSYLSTFNAIQELNNNDVLCPAEENKIGIVLFGTFYDVLKEQVRLMHVPTPVEGPTNSERTGENL